MPGYLQAGPDELATLRWTPRISWTSCATRQAWLLDDYPWLDLPKGATLEGYLAAGAYRVLPDTTPDELVRKMLDHFAEEVGPARMQAAKDTGCSFHEVLTLASIVERESRRRWRAGARLPASSSTGSKQNKTPVPRIRP